MENLFLAVNLIDNVKMRMRSSFASVSRLLDFGFRPVGDDCVHLSIQSLGRYERLPDVLIKHAMLIGSRVEVPAFPATFDRLQGFNGTYGRAVVLTSSRPADGFFTLRKAVFAEMQLAGMDVPSDLDFSPHVSLAYQRSRIPTIPVNPVTWIVHELVLVRSLIGRSKHICLGRWPLWMSSAPPT
jgi:RNA 2',3'-cyclic 3'-phosphodiesterase